MICNSECGINRENVLHFLNNFVIIKTEKRDTDAACRVLQMCWKPTMAVVGFVLFMELIYFNAIIMVITSDNVANNNESFS